MEEFELQVDGTKTLEQLIVDGKYDWEITGGMMINHKEQPQIMDKSKRLAHVSFLHYGHRISSEEVQEDMEKRNLRPTVIEESLSIGKENPDLQELFPIIGLGAGSKDFEAILFFSKGLGRGLLMPGRAVYFWAIKNGVWLPACRFAAVPKQCCIEKAL